ncbi:MAG: hypothetical protein QMD76_02280 [Anaerosomatales bacterium]|nr:hypothetical protein [Anaerosomatales bacterium]
MARKNRFARGFAGRALAVVLGVAVAAAFAVPAWALLTVPLHGAHVGASSQTFSWESGNGGLSDPVVWHFVLNGMDRSTPEAQLTVTFQNAGTKTVTARNDGQTQHFYVGTPGHDVLTAGFAVAATSKVNNLVLSHVWYDRDRDPGEDPEEPEDPGDGEEPGDPGDGDTGEEPGDPGDGDEPTDPGDGDTGEEPGEPGDGDTGEEPTDPGDGDTGEEPTDPGDGDTGEEDFLPFTDQPTDEAEGFLPYTGGEILALLTAAGTAALSGAALRRRNKSAR